MRVRGAEKRNSSARARTQSAVDTLRFLASTTDEHARSSTSCSSSCCFCYFFLLSSLHSTTTTREHIQATTHIHQSLVVVVVGKIRSCANSDKMHVCASAHKRRTKMRASERARERDRATDSYAYDTHTGPPFHCQTSDHARRLSHVVTFSTSTDILRKGNRPTGVKEKRRVTHSSNDHYLLLLLLVVGSLMESRSLWTISIVFNVFFSPLSLSLSPLSGLHTCSHS